MLLFELESKFHIKSSKRAPQFYTATYSVSYAAGCREERTRAWDGAAILQDSYAESASATYEGGGVDVESRDVLLEESLELLRLDTGGGRRLSGCDSGAAPSSSSSVSDSSPGTILA